MLNRTTSLKTTLRLGALAAASAVVLAACGGGGSGNSSSNETRLSLSNVKLENLGANFVYEGWVIVNGAPVSTGRFTVNAQGALSQSSFNIKRSDADSATKFVLTIEPAVDPNPGPSATHVFAGDFNSAKTQATLTTSDPAALGTNFAAAAGTFVQATPTTASLSTDEDQGIWWVNSASAPAAGLTLPTLPAGWKYEGWVVVNGTPMSTGTFTNPAAADSDGAGPTAGTDASPAFPGQDFITPAVNLTGGTAVITVEPDPDNSPMPFMIKPLSGSVTGNANNPQSMTNDNGATLPSGTVSITRS